MKAEINNHFDLVSTIALSVNCLPSLDPRENEHVIRAINELQDIAKAASMFVMDHDTGDRSLTASYKTLQQRLEPWRRSRDARREWERQHANGSAGNTP